MGGNVGGSASPSSTTTGSASPSGVGGKGAAGMVQPYQGGQQAQQGGFGPFGLGGFGGNQPQTQQVAGSPVENMLQSANQGQPQFMQQQNLGNAGLAGYPTDQLNKLQGLMGGFNGQFSPEADTFQNANPQGEQAALAAQRGMTGAQNDIARQSPQGIENLMHALGGYGKGGGGSMPNPYQQGGQQSSPFGLYSAGQGNIQQVQRPVDAQFNPASDEGMVAPSSQMAIPAAATPAPVAPAPVTQAAVQSPDQTNGLSFRGMTMAKGGKVR